LRSRLPDPAEVPGDLLLDFLPQFFLPFIPDFRVPCA
jgi:hypothetical protein